MSFSSEQCIFCNKTNYKIIQSTKHHTLIVTNRHVGDYFDLTNDEVVELNKILKKQKDELKILDSEISGFNIGVNIGNDAGQSIMHCHIHLIPRRKGDVDDPRGGVRGVIPSKQKYKRN
jgi:diadenosine tetraphosphate (Ap4A) HIT family hydrolase